MNKSMDFVTAVKMSVYQAIADTTRVPTADEVANALGAPTSDVIGAFQSLCQERLLVLEAEDPKSIRMAPPFSGIETPFRVWVAEKSYYANCVWDSLGVASALYQDAVVETTDAHTGEPMRVEIRNQRPIPLQCAVHFAVPAARWWENIVYT